VAFSSGESSFKSLDFIGVEVATGLREADPEPLVYD
jgi:hypothetical protein